jgi:hypothetical protein
MASAWQCMKIALPAGAVSEIGRPKRLLPRSSVIIPANSPPRLNVRRNDGDDAHTAQLASKSLFPSTENPNISISRGRLVSDLVWTDDSKR